MKPEPKLSQKGTVASSRGKTVASRKGVAHPDSGVTRETLEPIEEVTLEILEALRKTSHKQGTTRQIEHGWVHNGIDACKGVAGVLGSHNV